MAGLELETQEVQQAHHRVPSRGGTVAVDTVIGQQRGFVRRRRMEANVLEIGVGLVEGSAIALR